MLQLKNIKKSYTTGDFTQVALNDVSLNFRESEFVAILGQSGSGKTTLLNVIGGLDKYDSGDLIINGKTTKGFKDKDWDAYRNNSVGFIFQSYNLIPHLSIVDNVEMGMTLSGVASAEKEKKAREVLEKVGLKDHLHKKPNQLSGGQMQRVAIARALANNPDIILADEPTGALDTHTSEQIMDLIKEIAKDKLVIMVTHNPELAEKYADRTVKFSDGIIVADSNPLYSEDKSLEYKLKKTSMSFFTALKLSGKNIATKKWRTALTAFASSIGIIGIALILSLSNGFDKQINSYETGTLSNFPITISQSTANVDMMEMRDSMHNKEEESIDDTKVHIYDSSENTVIHSNKLSNEYLEYINKVDSALLDGITYTRTVNMNILKSDGNVATTVNTSNINFTSYPSKTEASGNYLEEYYNLLSGSFPKEKTDLVLIVDDKNKIDISVLEALGINIEGDTIEFNDIVGKEFKLVLNNDFYKKVGEYFTVNGSASNLIDMYNSTNSITLKIAGVIKPSDDSNMATMGTGLVYSDDLAVFFIDNAKNSQIVEAQKNSKFNVLTGESFLATETQQLSPHAMMGMSTGSGKTKDDILATLGSTYIPSSISLFPVDFASKESVIEYLDNWNTDLEDENMIIYTDRAAMVTELSGSIMDAITMVLIAFAAISLIVSSIMIGIITYISVMERTREIGVLRALGARKKDISRVFNAETFIIGACSGALAIGISYLLTIPINSILYKLTELSNVAELNPIHAVILIIISIVLTLIGGFIPAKMAAKKDPVVALRSE